MSVTLESIRRLNIFSTPEHWAAIPLRLIVGYGFMEHGYAKIVNGPENFVGILHAIGVPVPALMGWATILVELVGGLAVLAGVSFHWSACQWQPSCSQRCLRC